MSLTAALPPAKQLLVRPLLVLTLLFGICYSLGFDFVMGRFWYQQQGNQWALQPADSRSIRND